MVTVLSTRRVRKCASAQVRMRCMSACSCSNRGSPDAGEISGSVVPVRCRRRCDRPAFTRLRVGAVLVAHAQPAGVKISDDELASIAVQPRQTHPLSNYTICHRS